MARVAPSGLMHKGFWLGGDTLWVMDGFNLAKYEVTGIEQNVEDNPGSGSAIPGEYRLHQAYPNPFNPTTTIRYDLPGPSHVTITVYDLLGRQVARLVDGYRSAGRHSVNWDASELSSGMYFYSLQAGAWQDVKKAVLIR
ncbi:T9SS type A sorting domain-containing protein [bacterium]|nr:T9SS type A sorting domain-containing protein [bacterium]